VSLARKLNIRSGETVRVVGKPRSIDRGDVVTAAKAGGMLVFVENIVSASVRPADS
jgi:hypothetical protein